MRSTGATSSPPAPTDSFVRLVSRLTMTSERRRWEPYEAIEWDSAEMRISPDDPQWILPEWDPLGATTWYRDQPDRSTIGLWRVAALFQVGIEFEAILKQGLIAYAATLPNGHPSFRYAYHEIIEEAKHSMMFETFIQRCALPATWAIRLPDSYARLATLGSEMPSLFFLCILAGEAVFDHLQRRSLDEPGLHPLLAVIHRLHCDDEARHLSFARATLRDLVPSLDRTHLRQLRIGASMVVRSSADRMFELPSALVDHWQIPDDVVVDVEQCALARELRRDGLESVVSLCRELGILDDQGVESASRTPGAVDPLR